MDGENGPNTRAGGCEPTAGRPVHRPYFTRAKLVAAARKAVVWDYNRQLDEPEVCRLPQGRYPVISSLWHEHRGGEPCELHVRCRVRLAAGETAMVDVPEAFYAGLPWGEFEVGGGR